MTREEIKEELLNDEEYQFKTTVAAQFATLFEYLVKKGIFTKAEIDEMNKSTDEFAKKLMDVYAGKIAEELSKED